MIEYPFLDGKILRLGSFSMPLEGCNLDTLIEIFGEPKDSSSTLILSTGRVVPFIFDHVLGEIVAYLFFANIGLLLVDQLRENPAILSELQFELDDPIAGKNFGQPLSVFKNKSTRFAIYSKIFLARYATDRSFDGLSFLNPKLMDGPKTSFMACQFNLSGPKGLDLFALSQKREAERRVNRERQSYYGDYSPISHKLHFPLPDKGPTKK